ncbi:MAG: pilus assembly protein TadG-related protein [Pseudomonadota bacterium]
MKVLLRAAFSLVTNAFQAFLSHLLRFKRNDAGSTLIVFAATVPIVVGSVAVAVDYTYVTNQRERLQTVADIAATATARELILVNNSEAQLRAVAVNHVETQRQMSDIIGQEIGVDVSVDFQSGAVRVDLSQDWSPFFPYLLGADANAVEVSATARIMGRTAVCLLALMDYSIFAGIHMDNRSRVAAPGCGAYSNSTSRFSIRFDASSSMHAASICSAGGVLVLGRRTAQPSPVTDCPQIEDPLAERPHPRFGGCDFNGHRIDAAGPVSVNPGVYCGGLTIAGDAEATFQPGIYVIKDGPLLVEDRASLSGVDVGFFLTGPNSVFEFAPDTSISLEAPRNGPMAGLLFQEDLSVPYSFRINALFPHFQPPRVRVHKIRSNDARQLLGTLYLPRSILMIDANAPVAEDSAFTAIVAARIWLLGGPTLVINSDYAATEVPLPSSLAGGVVALTE